MHAGPYARLTLGAGPLAGTVNEGGTEEDPELDGTAGAIDAHAGTTLVPGFVVGVALTHARVFGSVDGASISTTQVAAFLDGYFWPQAGFHWGTALGYASLSREGDTSRSGFALSLWTGYDFWIASDWSLGPLLRANTTVTGEEPASTGMVTLGVSVLYQ